ncbi:NUDIX domain-containing protein [Candidatus Saccharibacteria bacterium]|nr:NUDIX domain-containing protein [Candidatus Saccharibacteria bacterium]
MTHVIQKEILASLITHKYLRFSKLKPKNIESNHFMYHLKSLMREGLVVKNEEGLYLLSSEGKQMADNLSLETYKPRKQPNIVTLITCQNEKGQWLVYKRARQPLLDQVGFVYGKLHLGETIAEAAHRELKEKTGLQCELSHTGDGYITIYEGSEPVSQILFHLFYGKNPYGEIVDSKKPGQAFWAWQEEFDHEPFMASMPELAQLAKESKERFFVELVYK